MGYIAILALGLVVLIVVVIGLLYGAGKRPTGKPLPDSARPPGQPSADAPTPAKSVVETPAQAENARQHTPPA